MCKISPACRLKFALKEALTAYLEVLDGYTLADFLLSKDEMYKLLGIE